MTSSSQAACHRDGGLRWHRHRVCARPARAAPDPWSAVGMDSTPDNAPDTADEPDELETADAPTIPDTTDDDGAPVDNPSGG